MSYPSSSHYLSAHALSPTAPSGSRPTSAGGASGGRSRSHSRSHSIPVSDPSQAEEQFVQSPMSAQGEGGETASSAEDDDDDGETVSSDSNGEDGNHSRLSESEDEQLLRTQIHIQQQQQQQQQQQRHYNSSKRSHSVQPQAQSHSHAHSQSQAAHYLHPSLVPQVQSTQPFTLAEMDILNRLDSLRMGLESYRSHTQSSLRKVSHQAAGMKHQVLSSLSSHLTQLEAKLHRAYTDNDGLVREHIASQIDRVRSEMHAARKRDTARVESVDSRMTQLETHVHEAQDRTEAALQTQAIKLQQLRTEMNTRGMAMDTPLTTALSASMSQSQTTLAHVTLANELQILRDANSALVARLDHLESSHRTTDRRSNDLQQRLQSMEQVTDSLQASLDTRVERVESLQRQEVTTREKVQRDLHDEMRRTRDLHSDAVATLEKQLVHVKAELSESERARHDHERRVKENERELAALRTVVMKLSHHQQQQQSSENLISPVLSPPLAHARTPRSSSVGPRMSTSNVGTGSASTSSASASPTLASDPTLALNQLSTSFDSRLRSMAHEFRMKLESEQRKRREVTLKVRGYEAIQKQVLEDVIALAKQSTTLKKEQARLKATKPTTSAVGGIGGESSTTVSALEKSLNETRAVVQELYAQVTNLSSSATEKQLHHRDDSHLYGRGTSASDGPPSFVSSSSSSDGTSLTEQQAQLVRSQKKLILRYTRLTQSVEMLRKSSSEHDSVVKDLRADVAALRGARDTSQLAAEVAHLKQESTALQTRLANDRAATSRTLDEFREEWRDHAVTRLPTKLAAFEGRVTELHAMSHNFETRLAHTQTELKAMQHTLTQQTASHAIDPQDVATLQTQVTNLQTSVKSLSDMKSSHATLESKLAALQLESNEQESFNYDISSQLQKLTTLNKSVESRVLFGETKLTAFEKRLNDHTQHVDSSLHLLTDSITGQATSQQKLQERMVTILDSVHELSHAVNMASSGGKKQELKVNAIEQQVQNLVETLDHITATGTNQDGASKEKEKEREDALHASHTTLNALLARLQALESEVS